MQHPGLNVDLSYRLNLTPFNCLTTFGAVFWSISCLFWASGSFSTASWNLHSMIANFLITLENVQFVSQKNFYKFSKTFLTGKPKDGNCIVFNVSEIGEVIIKLKHRNFTTQFI